MALFNGHRLTSYVAPGTTEIQGHSQLCRGRCEGPKTPSRTTDANLDCVFVENALAIAVLETLLILTWATVKEQKIAMQKL